MEEGCPLSVRISSPVVASHTLISSRLLGLPAAADDPLGVGAEGHAVDRAGVSLQRECFLARGGVPHLERPVAAAADDPLAVGAEGHAVGPTGVSPQRGLVAIEQCGEVVVLPSS